jgi:hypothetical protein
MARVMIANQALFLLATLPLTRSVSGFNNNLSDVNAFFPQLARLLGRFVELRLRPRFGECLPLPPQLHHIPNLVHFALSPLYFWTSRCASSLQCQMVIISQSRSGIRILASSLHILRQSQLCQILRLFELRHELREVLFFFSILFPEFYKKELNLPVCASNWTITCFSLFKLSVPARLRCIPEAARSHLLGSLVSGDLHARR